jgi:hypothetical protein
MTPEQALVAAREAEARAFTWKHQRVPGALAHQFEIEHGWMRSRCGVAIWTVAWWPAPESAARCDACSEISERSIDTTAKAILAVDGRAVA